MINSSPLSIQPCQKSVLPVITRIWTEKCAVSHSADRMSFDLDKYVTDGALNGVFYMVEQEEQKIRQNPAARITDLLKEVFGSKR